MAQLESHAIQDEAEYTRLEVQSRRFTIVVALTVALMIVAGAWFVGGREGFGQIGQGGVNSALLPKVGQPAPDFETTIIDLQGKPIGRVRLSDFRGQPVWLNFWGSWCPPCRAEMPDIVAANKELAPQGLIWLAVALDEPATASADFARKNNANFLIASDPDRADTGAAYPIHNFPTHILIDKDGIIREIVLSAENKDGIIERAQEILQDN